MKVVKKTKEYVIYQKGSGRYAGAIVISGV